MNKVNNIVDFKRISNLCELFISQMKKNSQKKFLFFKKNKKWIGKSYHELNVSISKIQSFFLNAKVRKGDRIMLVCSNRIDWFIADIAIMACGCITVPCFSTNNAEDNEFIIKDCKPKFIVLENINIYKNNEKVFKKIKHKILLIEENEKFKSFDKIITETKKSKKLILKKVRKTDICSIIYTSGTSGKPKGVMLSHENILHNVEAANELLLNFNLKEERFLSFLPLSHSYERMAGLYFPLSIGAKIYYCNSLENITNDFKEVNPTIVNAVPRLYENIYKKIIIKINQTNKFSRYLFLKTIENGSKEKNFFNFLFEILLELLVKSKIRNIFGKNLKTFVSGGAALDPKIADFFLKMNCQILQGYGQTEASPLISCNTVLMNKTSTVGMPVKNVKVKIADDQEILVKGKNVMYGYWNNLKLTQKTIIRGWLHTGDLGYMDEKNRIVITGRKKDLIVTSGGENISSQKIENLLIRNKEIIQAVVFGDRRPYLVALIIPEKKVGYQKISKLVKEANLHLNAHERIRKFLLIKKELTYKDGFLTQTLKIKKKNVLKYFEKEINKLY
tara:strand:+ start:13062 stop:14747 length:1686 start_codon:yes stop_codon:yes gene_type:complete